MLLAKQCFSYYDLTYFLMTTPTYLTPCRWNIFQFSRMYPPKWQELNESMTPMSRTLMCTLGMTYLCGMTYVVCGMVKSRYPHILDYDTLLFIIAQRRNGMYTHVP